MAAQWWVWVLVVAAMAAVLLVTLFVIGLVRDRRTGVGRHAAPRPTRDSFRRVADDEPPAPKKRAAVIVNPTKIADIEAFATQVAALFATQGWDVPLLLETTAEDPGGGQARQALEAGADLVCVVGGDGTVRTVAEVLSGGTTPLGLLPAGTGNLLARNLRLPEALEDALVIAMNGRNRHIDVGWVTLDPPEDSATPATVPVPAVGVSPEAVAEAIANAEARLRADEETQAPPEAEPEEAGVAADSETRAGGIPKADPVAAQDEPATDAEAEVAPAPVPTDDAEPAQGAVEAPRRHAFLVMAGLGFDAAIMDDTSDELKASIGWPAYISGGMRNLLRRRFHTTLVLDGGEEMHFRTRTVLAGNCGRLTGGIVLMPDASIDDGELNLVVISPKGLAGWAAVAAHVLTQRGQNHVRLDRFITARAHVNVDEPQAVQADGDVLGEACSLLLEVVPSSLVVRVGGVV